MNVTFWFTAGVLTGVTATAVSMPLWRGIGAALSARPRAYLIAAAGVAVFACSALLLYLAIGSPASMNKSATAALAHPVGGSTARTIGPDGPLAGSPSKPLSMEEATARLEARLNREGGSAEEWELLAKSYDFLGRSADASRVRARGTSGSKTAGGESDRPDRPVGGMPSMADVASQMRLLGTAASNGSSATPSTAPISAEDAQIDDVRQAKLEHQVKSHPSDASSWLALAEIYRRKHDAKAATSAYEKATALHAMTAQSWADYADVLGGQAGNSLGGAAGRAIDQALALDPKNPKALWLDASRALQERRYGDALDLWKRLRGVLPADSPDVRLVDANIAEAQNLAGGGAASDAKTGVTAEISGTVSVESRLASRVDRDATLFIYAKAADSPGPPLAVLRLTADRWPVSFHLDDSMAMLPSRRLSQFQKVIVEARISRTGQAAPAAGDLYVTSDVLTPSTGKKLALVINHEIG